MFEDATPFELYWALKGAEHELRELDERDKQNGRLLRNIIRQIKLEIEERK